jgi:glucose/arabinose dehydrogenase
MKRFAMLAAPIAAAGGIAVSAAAAASGPPAPVSSNGNTVQTVASGLHTPTSFAFDGGTVFEGDGGSESSSGPPTGGGVYVLKHGSATVIPGSPQFVAGLAWQGNALYVSGGSFTATGPQFSLFKWSGWDGTKFAHQKAIYTAPKKFDGFNGLAFGSDGRLYVGVDVGLTDGNDHGPAKTPFVYDILSFKPNGKGMKVYATGIRQPWQMVFTKSSSAPLVSDLGQDSGAKNPPDFILRVNEGDNYGFPKCNQLVKSKCKGFAKPFKEFKPHTDIMGLGVVGKNLYMTSFTGPGGKGPGGQVLTMPVAGGKAKPLITGFVAPTVGLGVTGHWVYVGELTGQVFRVKVS